MPSLPTLKADTRYEEVARDLLNRFCFDLGLSRVEGKQSIAGKLTGTSWELDAKGIAIDGEAIVIVECRRYTTSRLKQEQLASIAYRVQDTGAAGGITVSPFDLQSGAKKVAEANNIVHVTLTPESTPSEFQMQFLDKLFVGFHDAVNVRIEESLAITIRCADGTSTTENL